MAEDIFLTIRAISVRSALQPYLDNSDSRIRLYAQERLKELEESVFNLEDI